MDFLIEREQEGLTVREFLSENARISRTMLRHLKGIDNGICVNGAKVTVRHVLRAGELLTVRTEDEAASSSIVPWNTPLEIVFEDADFVVPSKPPFMPTHPSHNHFDDTLANALAYRYKESNPPFVFRPVNRLDRNTSGLVLVAKNRIAASRLFEEMKNGEIQKTYVAILRGIPPRKEGEIETYIRRAKESIIFREVCGKEEGGDYALTRYKVVFSGEGHCVVLCTPITGRTHQLRVHFAHIDCPIVGDELYGEESDYIKRHALHAVRLSLSHPSTGERLELSAPLPDDIRGLAESVFGRDDVLDVIF